MKKITIIALTLCGIISFRFAQSAFSPNATAVSINPITKTKAGAASFATTTHNFGEIKAGEAVSYTFDLKNTGEGDLVIMNVKPSCGCTVPEYTEDAIEPGKAGYVKAVFTPKSAGAFTKTLTVRFNNDDAPVTLKIKGVAN